MFDLERSIAEWRREMLAAGIKAPVPLEELEIHLREEIGQLTKTGATSQEAFETARNRIGQTSALNAEFRKVDADSIARERAWVLIYCVAFPIFYFFLVVRGLVKMEMSFAERISAFIALVLTCLFIWSTQYYYKCLPAVLDKRQRLGIYLTCLFSWMLCGGVFTNFILPHLNLTASQLTVTVLWLMTPVAAISGIGYGLNESARRHIPQPT